MNRMQRAGVGLSLMALVGVGAVGGGAAFAQDATPTPSTGVTDDSTSTAPEETERNAFIDAFAAQLGVTDEAQIDAAILAAYQQVLADKVAAGDITQEQADELLARIEAGDVPFGVGGFGRGDHDGMRGDGPGKDRGGKSDRPSKDAPSTDDSTTPAADATPAAGVSAFY